MNEDNTVVVAWSLRSASDFDDQDGMGNSIRDKFGLHNQMPSFLPSARLPADLIDKRANLGTRPVILQPS